MPPLLLDDDEAIAIAVGLRTAARASVTGIEETAVRALVKLEQVLPAHLRRRVAALGSATIAPPLAGPDGRAAASDGDRHRLPRQRVPAVRLPQPRRDRQPPAGRAPHARQPRPPLVPRRLGSRPRGLADFPCRPARQARLDWRALHGREAPRKGRGCLSSSRASPGHRTGSRRVSPCTSRPTRSAGASAPTGGRSSRSTPKAASTGPATTTSPGSRCGSRCSASTSRFTSLPSWQSTFGRSPTGFGAQPPLYRRLVACGLAGSVRVREDGGDSAVDQDGSDGAVHPVAVGKGRVRATALGTGTVRTSLASGRSTGASPADGASRRCRRGAFAPRPRSFHRHRHASRTQ